MHDDDRDDYVPESEQIERLRAEVADLRARIAALEREIEKLDVGKTREEMAALSARVDMLVLHRDLTARQLGRIGMTVTVVLFVALLHLSMSLTASLR
jgi:uncharacterized protein YhaN